MGPYDVLLNHKKLWKQLKNRSVTQALYKITNKQTFFITTKTTSLIQVNRLNVFKAVAWRGFRKNISTIISSQKN